MIVERAILVAVWVLCLLLIPFKIPKHRAREAVLLFLFAQMTMWIMSLLFVEWRIIENPIREFPRSTESNFTNNFVLFPFISTLFSLYYPSQKPVSIRVLYHLRVVMAIGVYLVIIESYTDLLNYMYMNVFLHMIILWLVMNAVRIYAGYFFQKKIQKEG